MHMDPSTSTAPTPSLAGSDAGCMPLSRTAAAAASADFAADLSVDFFRAIRAGGARFFGAPKFRRKFPRTVFTVPRAFFGATFGGQVLAPRVAPKFGRGRPLSNFGATFGAIFGAVLAHFWRQNLVTASARKQPRDPRSGLPEARGADAAVCNSSAIARHLAL